ncbi:MAG: hypothetical protein ABI554_12525 [Flavobacterium sp.]
MIKILHYLFLVRFRKLVSKDDHLAVFLIVLLYFATAFLVYKNYESFRNYMPLFFVDIIAYHLQRRDIEILKLKKNYKTILLTEYIIYSLPFYLVLAAKKEFIVIPGILLFKILLINAPRLNLKIVRYPFDLFNIHWHIVFRTYKLIYVFPFLLALIYVAVIYKNENLILLVFFVLSFIACIPSFERETREEISINPFSAGKYLFYQLKSTFINTTYLLIPVFIMLCFFQQWEKLLFALIIFIPPLVNVFFKYIYFDNNFLHQITFAFFIASNIFLFGIPILVVPFIYKKAIEKLNIIKTC